MGGRKGTKVEDQNKPKKGLRQKKAAIDKEIELAASKTNALIRTPPRVVARRILQAPPPKPIIPSLFEEKDFLILDQRHEGCPGKPLIRLPCEPTTPRALRYVPKGQFPFLELPGEIRNKIYDLAITQETYAIRWVNNNHKSKTLTYYLAGPTTTGRRPELEPNTPQRRRSLDYRRRVIKSHLSQDDIRQGPAVLLYVCKQMSNEAASVLYSKSIFNFRGLGTLRHFLDHLRPISTASISKLAIDYREYGHPSRTDDQIWKAKHDKIWAELCWRITDNCKSLTHLSLNLTLNTSPFSYVPFDRVYKAGDIGSHWIKPLLAFKDVGITRCWGSIDCASRDSDVLKVLSLMMRQEILGELWNEEAEQNRDCFGNTRGKKPRRTNKLTPGPVVRTLDVSQEKALRKKAPRKKGPPKQGESGWFFYQAGAEGCASSARKRAF